MLLGQQLDPLVGGPALERRGELGLQLVEVLDAVGVAAKAGVLGQLGPVDRLAELRPELLVGAGDVQVAVGRGVGLVRREHGVLRAHPLGLLADERLASLLGEPRQGSVVHPELDPLALARRRPAVERADDAEGGPHRGDEVGGGQPNLRRLAALRPGDGHDPARPLHEEVVAGTLAPGAGLAERGDRAVDDRVVVLPDVVVADAEPIGRAGPVVLDEDVRLGGEVVQRLPGLVGLEVQLDAPLAVVHRPEVGRLAAVGGRDAGPLVALGVDEGRPGVPVVVADLGPLDLDHLGALVGEHQRREPAGDERREVQYGDAVQQPAGRRVGCHGPTKPQPGTNAFPIGGRWVDRSAS
ncbi:MAG: hypothetical protein U5J98_11260 [Halobacteriales archaeon]|nr:hypothetical protein [Halobacteriales archaeon]